jgi:tetratricopeptide (TPR) repeat protein
LQTIARFLEAREFAQALASLLPLVQLPKPTARVLEWTILCYHELRDDMTAWALSDVSISLHPDDSWLWSMRARLAVGQGKKEEAREAAERALALDAGNVAALTQLYLVAPFEKGSKQDKQLRRAVQDARNGRAAQAAVHQTLAKMEERAGHHARAFHHYKQSNLHQDRTYDARQDAAFVAAQQAVFQRKDHKAAPKYLFIGGMPRSGTTLLETALMRHPQVSSIGETASLKVLQSQVGQGAEAFDWCKTLDAAQLADMRRQLVSVLDHRREGAQIVLEKLPLGVFQYGLVQWLLPEARFVVMMRHPLDCGLSNYVAHFDTGYGYATRLATIAQKFKFVEASAKDYAEKLGDLMRLQSYRSLVERPEASLRAVLDLLELPWDARVLQPEKAQHVQRTLSLMQVREPFNRKGLNRWQAYAHRLAPLEEALGGADYIARWEAEDAQR